MLDRHLDMTPHDRAGRARGFGSRRHYDFSHWGYRTEAVRITGILAQRFGSNPHVAAWQTDNEYGCHDTTLSYSNAALRGLPGLAAGEIRRDRCAQRRLGQRVLVDGISQPSVRSACRT
jgi:beta-galactosidase